jgi:hypothetical protein
MGAVLTDKRLRQAEEYRACEGERHRIERGTARVGRLLRAGGNVCSPQLFDESSPVSGARFLVALVAEYPPRAVSIGRMLIREVVSPTSPQSRARCSPWSDYFSHSLFQVASSVSTNIGS